MNIDQVAALEKLAKLLTDGILNKSEFLEAKQKILSGPTIPTKPIYELHENWSLIRIPPDVLGTVLEQTASELGLKCTGSEGAYIVEGTRDRHKNAHLWIALEPNPEGTVFSYQVFGGSGRKVVEEQLIVDFFSAYEQNCQKVDGNYNLD
jgi:hypothetical protein